MILILIAVCFVVWAGNRKNPRHTARKARQARGRANFAAWNERAGARLESTLFRSR